MKTIEYLSHLKFRLKIRQIPRKLPERIFYEAKEKYFDRETRHFIAIKKLRYKGKNREMAVSYDETEEKIKLITVHPIKSYQKQIRIAKGRWVRI